MSLDEDLAASLSDGLSVSSRRLIIAESEVEYLKGIERANRTYLSWVVRLKATECLRNKAYTPLSMTIVAVAVAIFSSDFMRQRFGIGMGIVMNITFVFCLCGVAAYIAKRYAARHIDKVHRDLVDHADRGAAEAYANMKRRRELLLPPHTKNPLDQEGLSS